jgi:hypothetical protein
MVSPDETLLRVLAMVRQEVVPGVNTNPQNDANGFFAENRTILRDVLRSHLAILGPRSIAGLIVELTPTFNEEVAIRAKVLNESARLASLGMEPSQIIAATSEMYAYEIYQVRTAPLRKTASQVRSAQERQPPRGTPPGGDPLVLSLQRAGAGTLRMLAGFLGKSSRPGHSRLYSTLELNEYVDIPTDAIVRTVDLRTMVNRLGGTVLWVQIGTELLRGQEATSKVEVQGQFLSGEISRGSGGGMGGSGGGGRGEYWSGWCARGEYWSGWCARGEYWSGWCQGGGG